MRPRTPTNTGVTLTELMITITIAAVVMLIGWVTWEIGWREAHSVQMRSASSRDAYGVLHVITKEILRAQSIDIPDPDYPKQNSIQLHVETAGGIERRTFRLEGDALVLDLKDVSATPLVVFDGVTALSFRRLGALEDGVVEIVCTLRHGRRPLQMRTVARKRN